MTREDHEESKEVSVGRVWLSFEGSGCWVKLILCEVGILDIITK